MRIYVDLETDKIIRTPGVTAEIENLQFKRAASTRIEVQFTREGVVQELPIDATGIFGIKKTGKYDDAYVAAALAWVKTGTTSSTVYTFTLSLINTTLDGLFFVDEDVNNDVVELTLMGELQWTTGGNAIKSPTIPILVENDVNRGGESLPTTPALVYGVFWPFITALEGGTPTDLDGVEVATLTTGMIVQVLVDVEGVREWLAYVLTDGPATEDAPGHVATLDDPDRHWLGAVGPSGPAGTDGSDGADGVDGADGATIYPASVAVPSGTTPAIDWSLAPTRLARVLAANTTFSFTNEVDGKVIIVPLTQDASSVYTTTWSDVDVWIGTAGGAPPDPPALSKTNIYTFVKCGSVVYGSVGIGG